MSNECTMASARESMAGYVSNGAAYWPCAAYFTLIGLDGNGESTGAAADVCRACVREVAMDAVNVVDGVARVPFTGSDLGKPGYLRDGALAECGPDPAYEMWGNSALPGEDAPAYCAQCHTRIE